MKKHDEVWIPAFCQVFTGFYDFISGNNDWPLHKKFNV